jgi:hypothetical protein
MASRKVELMPLWTEFPAQAPTTMESFAHASTVIIAGIIKGTETPNNNIDRVNSPKAKAVTM